MIREEGGGGLFNPEVVAKLLSGEPFGPSETGYLRATIAVTCPLCGVSASGLPGHAPSAAAELQRRGWRDTTEFGWCHRLCAAEARKIAREARHD